MQKKIVIIGAGWLGIDLVNKLSTDGYSVFASYRNENNRFQIETKRAQAFFLDLNKDLVELMKILYGAEALIILIPPRKVHNYAATIGHIVEMAGTTGVPKVIFTSSTGVYSDIEVAKEETDLSSGMNSNELLQAENFILNSRMNSKYILRLAGLIGIGRHPGRFLAGKSDLPAPQAPVNLVQKEDVIQIIEYCVYEKIEPGIYNICSDEHPSRQEYYTEMAKRADLVQPKFKDDLKKGKLISGEKLHRQIEHLFKSIWEI